VGDRVAGRYQDGKWYLAEVSGLLGGAYVLSWDDGDKSDTVKAAGDVCLLPLSPAAEEERRTCDGNDDASRAGNLLS
jgi:hypothetical protein